VSAGCSFPLKDLKRNNAQKNFIVAVVCRRFLFNSSFFPDVCGGAVCWTVGPNVAVVCRRHYFPEKILKRNHKKAPFSINCNYFY